MNPRREVASLYLSVVSLLWSATVVLGCYMEGPSTGANVRDSAGITIREFSGVPPIQLRLTRSPILSIKPDVPGAYALYRVRDVLRARDGGIVVSNNGTELLFFDRNGDYTHTVGQRGQGPGEFVNINSVRQGAGDSLFVFDSRLDRVTVMDRSGAIGSMMRLDHRAGGAYYDILGVLPDRRLVMMDVSMIGGGLTSGPVSPSFDVHAVDRESGVSRLIGSFPRAPIYRYVMGNRVMNRPVPFHATAVIGVHEDQLIIGDGNTPDIRFSRLPGTTTEIVRLAHDPVPVTRSDIERYQEMRISGARSERNQRIEREVLDDIDFADSWPFYRDLRVAEDGRVWVRADGPDIPDGVQRWVGYDTHSESPYVVDVYGDVDVTQFGDQMVVGVRRDDFDVEHVVIHGFEQVVSSGGT